MDDLWTCGPSVDDPLVGDPFDGLDDPPATAGPDPTLDAPAHRLLAGNPDELRPEPDAPTGDVETAEDLAFAEDTDPGDAADRTARPDATDITAGQVVETEPAGGILGGLLVGGTIAAVLVLVGLVSKWWHTRRSDSSGTAVTDPVEVGRLLNSARTDAEVGRIVVAEASRITAGEAALFSGRSTASLAEIAASAAFPADLVLPASELERALDLALPGAFAVDGLEVLAVPLTERGMVGGVLLATGPLTSDRRREQNLCRLASITGASLAAAHRRGELEDLSGVDAVTELADRR